MYQQCQLQPPVPRIVRLDLELPKVQFHFQQNELGWKKEAMGDEGSDHASSGGFMIIRSPLGVDTCAQSQREDQADKSTYDEDDQGQDGHEREQNKMVDHGVSSCRHGGWVVSKRHVNLA